MAKNAFDLFDTDGDGKLDREEFSRMMVCEPFSFLLPSDGREAPPSLKPHLASSPT